MTPTKVKADKDKVKAILKERDWQQNLLAEKMGCDPTTLSGYWKDGFTPMAYKMMCMILGKAEEDLIYKEPEVRPVTPVGEILSNNQVMEEINILKVQISTIMADMRTMAETMSKMERAVMETKGQMELSAEDISAINSRTVSLSGTCNRILGQQNAKLKATRKGA